MSRVGPHVLLATATQRGAEGATDRPAPIEVRSLAVSGEGFERRGTWRAPETAADVERRARDHSFS
jgi:hypothetical protein